MSFHALITCIFAACYFADATVPEHDARLRKLNDLTLSSSPIYFDSEQFDIYTAGKRRNYSLVLLLTALSHHRGCKPCVDALHQFEDLSNSWRRSKHRNDQLFLAVIDFDRSPDVFEKLKLNKAPSIVHIGPHGVVSPSDHMNVEQLGYSAEAIASWIAERTSIRIYVVRPPSYAWIMLLAIFLTAGVALLWFKRIDVSYFTNPALWCVLSLGVIFCGISGQVYNQIRGPPLLHATPNGEIKAFIYPGSHYQFVAETIIVIFLYVLATVGILFIHQVDGTVEAGRKKILISAGLILFSVAFSLVLSVFRKKYHGYPYSFLF